MLVASSLEYICPHEPQKPAVFAATAIPPQIRQAIAKATKAKAGSNTSRASPVISAVMVRGVVPHARHVLCGGGRNRTLTQILVGRMLFLSGLSRCHSCKGCIRRFVMAVEAGRVLPGGGACRRGGSVDGKRLSFCYFLLATIIFASY